MVWAIMLSIGENELVPTNCFSHMTIVLYVDMVIHKYITLILLQVRSLVDIRTVAVRP